MGTKEEQDDLDKRTARGDFVDPDLAAQGRRENETEEERIAREAEEAAAKKPEGEDDKKDPPPDDKKKGEDKEGAVPYGRFAEVNDKFTQEREARLRAEGEANALRRQLVDKPAGKAAAAEPDPDDPAPGEVDPRKLRKMAGEALLEGDNDKASLLHNKADAIIEERSTARATENFQAASDARDMNAVTKEIYEAYPFLNNAGPEANAGAISRVIALRNTIMQTEGLSAAEALREASETVGSRITGKTLGKAALAPAIPAIDEGQARNAAALKKAAEAANHQPSLPAGGKGERSRTAGGDTEIDVAKLSDKQFRELPDAEKARLRGDVVA